jgi:hypothetical protein
VSNRITGSSTVCTLHHVLLAWSNTAGADGRWMRETINSYNILVEKSQGKRQLEISVSRQEGNMKMNIHGLYYKDMNCIQLTRNKV